MKIKHTSSSHRQWRFLSPGRLLAGIIASGLLLGAAASLQAAAIYTMTNTVTANWNTPANWTNTVSPNTYGYPNAVDDVAILNTSASVDVPAGVTVTNGYIFNTNGVGPTWQSTAARGTNYLATSSGQPTINCINTITVKGGYLAGNQGFLKLGAGQLTYRFDNVNYNAGFSGPIVVGAGTLTFSIGPIFGNASSVTISNGAILQNFDSTSPRVTAFPTTMPFILAGGGQPTLGNQPANDTVLIEAPVQESPGSGTGLKYIGNGGLYAAGATILAGTNTYTGPTLVQNATLITSSTSTGGGSHTVGVNAADGVLVTAPGTSLAISNMTLAATTAANSSPLVFAPGTLGVPTAPMMYVTNLLTLGSTNFQTPIGLYGGGWQVGTYPLLKYGSITNVYTNGLFNGFVMGALPVGVVANLVDGTATNQINLSVTSITPLVYNAVASAGSWVTAGIWATNGVAATYADVNAGFGPAVVFNDLAGLPNIVLTDTLYCSPNSVVFNITNSNYTLTGAGGIINYCGLTLNGSGRLTNGLNNAYFGGTVLNGGVMVLNSASALGHVNFNTNYASTTIKFNGGTLQFSANNKVDYSSRFTSAANQPFSLNTGGQAISLAQGLGGTGSSLTRTGTGTLTLNGASSYTGATTNAAGTLKLGVANAIPATSALTLGSSGNSAILDLAGFNQQVAGLTMDPAATVATITNSSTVNPVTLIFKGGTSTYGGIIAEGTRSIGLTIGSGSLTLSGANTYSGDTLITNSSSLVIGSGGTIATKNIIIGSGSTFDDSANGYTTVASGNVSGIGSISGNVDVLNLATVTAGFYGSVTNHGSLTFNNNLTLETGASCKLNLDTTVASANNDKIVVSGSLTANDANGNMINISAPSGAFDQINDYTLITSPNTITGTFNATPNWVGPTKPSNYAHYTVVTTANSVKLHYSVGVLLSGAGSVSPTTGLHQRYLFTVLVTPGTGSTGIGVTGDLSGIGGVNGQVFAGSGNTYTYTLQVPGSITPGTYSIPFTVTDAQSDTFTANINVTIANGTLAWNGVGPDNKWSSTNWLNGAVLDSTGVTADSLMFAGATRLGPVMDTSYNVNSLTFSNNAGAFVVTNDVNAGILTLNAGGTVENDSANAVQLNVPISLAGSAQFNTPAGSLTVGGISGSVGFTKSGSGKLTVASPSTYSGNVSLGGGTLAIAGGDDILPISSGVINTATATIDLGGHSQTLADLEVAASTTEIVSNGNLTVNSTPVYYMFNSQASSATLNLSGLSSFNYGGPGDFRINGNTTSAGQIYNLYLAAGSNYITANNCFIGNGGNTGIPTANLYLGATNVFNVYTFQLADYRGQGNVYFQSGLVSSNLTLRGKDGVSPVLTMNIPWESSGGSYSGTMDLGAGNVDALVQDLYVPYALQASETGTLKFGNGIFNITTLHLASSSQAGPGTGTFGNFIQNGGAALISTIEMGHEVAGNTGTNGYFPSYTLAGGTLYAALITGSAAADQYVAANSVRNLNMSGGTLATYDSATDLTISGVDTTSAGLINIVLGGNTTNIFFADTNRLIDAQNTVIVKGSGNLNKTGAGTLHLEGTNTYTGNTTVSGGTLILEQPTLFVRSTVTVATNAVLQMNFSTTNQVNVLVINGVSKPPGVYSISTDPIYLQGTGYLLVVPLSTNAFLTSLALTPTDNLTPNFVSNTFAYFATNATGSPLTVTAINGNSAATNKLILNGVTLQTLVSGVPSGNLTLGPGSTNVLKVLVTAQDGVTTNLYTVNLTQLSVNTATFTMTNSVSGGNLNLSWPADRLGWRLQVQTNTLGTGLGTNWFTWPGSTTVTSETIPINAANGNVFYRMVYP